MSAFSRPELDKLRPYFEVPDAIAGFETEFLISDLYLHVCAADVVFNDNPDYARQFLDALHEIVSLFVAESEDFPDIETFQNLLEQRYATYAASTKNGLDEFCDTFATNMHRFLSEQNPHWKINLRLPSRDEKWGCWPTYTSSCLTLRLSVRNRLTGLIDTLSRLRRKHNLGK